MKLFFSKFAFLFITLLTITFTSCLDSSDNSITNQDKILNSNKNSLIELEKEMELLKWENARLSLKLRSVDGAALVRDIQTNLWHFDVERTPYTGNASENFEDGKLRAEASFLRGKRDGIFRYWYNSGVLESEGQWFDGKEDGLFREWNEEGQLLKAVKYKSGELIEVLKN